MKLSALTLILATALCLSAGAALAKPSHSAAPKTLTVVMHDPGCHWFLVHGKVVKTASVTGPIRLKNLDENTLKVASRTGLRFVHVGKSIVLDRGNYVVMMVGQAVDDNYLKLTIH